MHEYYFEVRGNEIDSFDHVNNAVYLNYFEAARWMYFHDKGWAGYLQNQGLHLVVFEANLRYIKELRMFDQCVVKTEHYCDGQFIIADQALYLTETNRKCAKAEIKMIFVSRAERLVYDVPDFIANELSKGVKQCLNA